VSLQPRANRIHIFALGGIIDGTALVDATEPDYHVTRMQSERFKPMQRNARICPRHAHIDHAVTLVERLQRAGLSLSMLGDKVTARLVSFGREAAKYGLAPGDEVIAVLVPADRPSRYWFALPALLLLAAIVALQRRRLQPKVAVAV
jgi:hypothetical protein